MARRASSSTHPLWLASALVLVLGFAAGGFWLYSRLSDPFRTLAPFPLPTYLESAASLRGNVYRLEGTVANQLGWSPQVGRLYSVETQEGAGVVALLIPAEFNATNLQKGQQFSFEVEVIEKGLLRARALKKA